MKSYEDHVKDLLLGLVKLRIKDTQNAYSCISLFGGLPDEVIRSIAEKIMELNPASEKRARRRLRMDDHSRELAYVIDDFLKIDKTNFDRMIQVLEDAIRKSHLDTYTYPQFSDSLERIAQIFHLDEVSKKVLTYLFVIEEEDNIFSGVLSTRRFRSTLVNNYKLLDESRGKVVKGLSKRGDLFVCGLLTYSAGDLEMLPSVSDCLRGITSEDFNDGFDTTIPKIILPGDSFSIPQEKMAILKHLLQSDKPINILFEGLPGSGKTSLAYSLIAEAGLQPIYLKHDIEESDSRRVSLYAARKYSMQTRKVLIVDEADKIISHKKSMFSFSSGDEADKSWINYFLDTNKTKIIWITNDKTRIEDSTCRRFNYVLNFRAMNTYQRKNIWMNVIEKYNQTWISKHSEFENIVKRFTLDAGSIDDAVSRVTDHGESMEFLRHYLTQKYEFIKGETFKEEKPQNQYQLHALNLSHSPDEILNALRKFDQRKEVLTNFNLLLQGHSGTGKTEFVKHIGKELNKEIITKTSSDLLSMWVGEAEKNIARAFDEAEKNESILFLDEADSFFQSREGAQKQWEITQVNEILIRMEKFKGILICSTNFLKNFDKAALRRFQFKVSFNYLNSVGKKLLFESYFPGLNYSFIEKPLDSMVSITPGDFKNVALRMNYRDFFTEQDVIFELSQEVSYKDNKRSLGL